MKKISSKTFKIYSRNEQQFQNGNSATATAGMFGALQPEGCGFESTSRGYIRCLAAGGLRVRIYLKPPRRDPGQVLHSQLLMRFGVKLRFSVRAVVGSTSE